MVDAGFLRTVDDGLRDPRAFAYDMVILDELRSLADRFCADPPRVAIEGRPWFPTPRTVRAMIFVETGGPASGKPDFDTFPLQVGKLSADKALPAMQAGNGAPKADQGAGLVPTDAARKILQASTGKHGRGAIQGEANVRLGINYLIMLQVSAMKSVSTKLVGPALERAIGAGDSFSTLAGRHGSTVEAIAAANEGVDSNRLRLGQKILVPPAEMVPTLGFDAAIPDTQVPAWIARRYNGGRDPAYAEKLRYIFAAFGRTGTATKAPGSADAGMGDAGTRDAGIGAPGSPGDAGVPMLDRFALQTMSYACGCHDCAKLF